MVIALGLLAVSTAFRRQVDEVPAVYDTPENLPNEPGELVRSEPSTLSCPTTPKRG